MLKTIKQKVLVAGSVIAAVASNASAATLSNGVEVDFTSTLADLGLVFAAVIGVVILLFGFRKIYTSLKKA